MSYLINKENDNEIETYLQTGLTTQQIANLLRLEGKDEKKIAAFVEKYEDTKHKINKYIKKFIDKIKVKYGDLAVPELVKGGMKFAQKHGFTKAEEKAFIDQVMNSDSDNTKKLLDPVSIYSDDSDNNNYIDGIYYENEHENEDEDEDETGSEYENDTESESDSDSDTESNI